MSEQGGLKVVANMFGEKNHTAKFQFTAKVGDDINFEIMNMKPDSKFVLKTYSNDTKSDKLFGRQAIDFKKMSGFAERASCTAKVAPQEVSGAKGDSTYIFKIKTKVPDSQDFYKEVEEILNLHLDGFFNINDRVIREIISRIPKESKSNIESNLLNNFEYLLKQRRIEFRNDALRQFFLVPPNDVVIKGSIVVST
jgi:hypothetical protein